VGRGAPKLPFACRVNPLLTFFSADAPLQVQMSLEECVADFAKVIKVIRLMTSTAIQLVVTLTGWIGFSLCYVLFLFSLCYVTLVLRVVFQYCQ